jgi:LuxR family maltose regulon positive regulatory protein
MIRGDRLAVERWSAALDKRFDPQALFQYENELTLVTLARLHIFQRKLPEAIHLLSCLEEFARSCERHGRLIEILTLKALAFQAAGEMTQADSDLSKCLALASPEGYKRVFLDEGQPMRALLIRWLAHSGAAPDRDYAAHLIPHLEPQHTVSLSVQEKSHIDEYMVEPLSPREVEVLRLIALGRTNQEIAWELVVSPGTVKAHTSSIYRKLYVANRTEAVARARQMSILP